jgi:hypothetical protein
MTKTRDLANLVSGSNPLVDGVIDYSEITNTPAPFDPDTLAAVAVSGSYADLGGKPALATVATSGSFTDLSNQPAPFNPATLAAVAVSGSFNDLSNQPAPFNPATLAAVATTGAYGSLSGTPALATVATTGAYGNLTGTPTLAAVATTGAYSSLSGVPALAAVATTGAYSSLSGTPALAAVATTGAYSSLSGLPAATTQTVTVQRTSNFSHNQQDVNTNKNNNIYALSWVASSNCFILPISYTIPIINTSNSPGYFSFGANIFYNGVTTVQTKETFQGGVPGNFDVASAPWGSLPFPSGYLAAGQKFGFVLGGQSGLATYGGWTATTGSKMVFVVLLV